MIYHDKATIKTSIFIVLIWISLCILASLTSCSGKKAFTKYASKHPEILAKECLDKFPAKETYIQGKIDTLINYQTIKGDSVECPKALPNKVVFVKCPDSKVMIKTLIRVDTIIKKDSSALYLLNVQNEKVKSLELKIKELKQDKRQLYMWLIFLIIFIGINLYFKIKKHFL